MRPTALEGNFKDEETVPLKKPITFMGLRLRLSIISSILFCDI